MSSLLAELHNDEMRNVSDELLEKCQDAATETILMAGYDLSDSDLRGEAMEETVQSLLMMLFARVPQLADRILGNDEHATISLNEIE